MTAFPNAIFGILTGLMLLFVSSPTKGQNIRPSDLEIYRQSVYESYVLNRMPQWEATLRQMERAYASTPDPALLYDILLAQYGLIGFYLGTGQNSKGQNMLERAEINLSILETIPAYKTTSLVFGSAFLAFRISLRPIRAVQLGPRSYRLLDQALASDPGYARVWIEKGNAAFFTPVVFGGNKQEAISHYRKAIELLEKNMPMNFRWLYLSTLVSLAGAYEKTGNLSMAILTLEKALRFEPRFTWVKDEMLPQYRSASQSR